MLDFLFLFLPALRKRSLWKPGAGDGFSCVAGGGRFTPVGFRFKCAESSPKGLIRMDCMRAGLSGSDVNVKGWSLGKITISRRRKQGTCILLRREAFHQIHAFSRKTCAQYLVILPTVFDDLLSLFHMARLDGNDISLT